MKIAYRRMSGAIGYTQCETGTRGLWLEKRNALWTTLTGRKHEVDYVNRMTKFSKPIFDPVFGPDTHDFLFIEFGSSNQSFYGKDLEETVKMIRIHRGRVVFLCDDPDLQFIWKTFGVDDWTRWSAWHNAIYPQAFGGQPVEITNYDFPFASLIDAAHPKPEYEDVLLYIGRPNGRKAAVNKIISSGVNWRVMANPKEWVGLDVAVQPAPPQALRAGVYSGMKGCLAIADSKHKKLGWRTGRAYHAINAGIPVLAEADHAALAFASTWNEPDEIFAVAGRWKDASARAADWRQQWMVLQGDRTLACQVLEAHGL